MSSPATKLLLITDAYGDQVNGVVRTWTETIRTMREQGDKVEVLHPNLFRTLPGKFYHDVDLVRPSKEVFTTLDHVIRNFDPDSIHVATPEGPLGMMGKAYLARNGIEHSSSFHTDIKGFLKERPWLKWLAPTADVFTRLIHKGSQAVLAPTKSVVDELRQKGLDNVVQWTRGVNLNNFELADTETKIDLRRQLGLNDKEGPIWLNVGRVSNEKNLQAFLDLDLPGTKVIVGDGPDKNALESKYEKAITEGKIIFAGMQKGEDLKNWYRAADIFVFPSRFDTFGLVNIEALASGLPVAAYPVKGPSDIFSVQQDKQVGFLNDDLREACLSAYGALRQGLKPEDCRNFVRQHYTWENVVKVLKENLVDLKEDLGQRIELEPRNHLDLELMFDADVDCARVMCFSDIHISTFAADLPCHDHTKQFVRQLKGINKTVKNSDKKERKDVLVLNGDIFDLLESYVWEYHKLPTTSKMGRIKNVNMVLQLFTKMTEAQKPLFAELREFLKNSKNSEIVYLPGNHDHLFKIVPELREIFISLVCGDEIPEAAKRIRFTDTLNVPQMKLRAEHGHRIDKYDYSENGVPNWGDYLSLVKVNLVRHIVDRLEALKTNDQSRNAMLDKHIARILKVEYIRDAQLFPAYIEQVAENAKADRGVLGKEIYDAIMQSTDDLALFLRKTPFLTRAEVLIPQKSLRGKAFLKFFMRVINYIYKEQTHKNSLQMDEAVRLHKAEENVVCWTGGHTHDAGQDDRLVSKEGKRDQRVVMVNSGTYIPTKFGAIRGTRSKKQVEFNRTLQPRGGVIFKAKFDPKEVKQVVHIRPLSGDNSSYNFYKAM